MSKAMNEIEAIVMIDDMLIPMLMKPDKTKFEIARCDALTLAKSALRAQSARENPQPLTMGELKERAGKPVWIKNEYGKITCRVLTRYLDSLNQDSQRFIFSDNEQLFVCSYGTGWLAYDHEIKESDQE
jgi:hypothetical protein